MEATEDPMIAALERMPDEELEHLYASIKSGEAKCPADSFGFTPESINTIEQIALAYYRTQRYDQASLV